MASLGDHPLGLLDDDPAGEGLGELLVEELGVERGAVLEDGDGGDVGERLRGDDVVVAQGACREAEQVEDADDVAAQAHRDGVGGEEARRTATAANRASAGTR